VRAWAIGYRALSFPLYQDVLNGPWKSAQRTTLANDCLRNRIASIYVLNSKEAAMSTILLTGGSGFIGSHSILQLLAAGYQVRTTVRSLKREGEVRAMLKEGGAEPGDRLSCRSRK
jgi:NAD-dependent epimerase/dehydratase family protein